MSRSDWEDIHVRQYEGVTAREVQDAAEKVLRLADHDFSFQYPDGRLIASRNWTVFAVIAITGGKDHWTVETSESNGVTRVTTTITRESSTTTAAPVVGGSGVAPVVGSTPGALITQGAPYQLFWERLEYTIGKRDVWTTCDQFKGRIKDSTRARDRGQIDALCGITADDVYPQ
ncbi:hypothetical protein CSC70_03920 [Pseudoxanthomonas kalamensis DSM 18571]|uniref:hypothetical protein n=1 Tax=Pseudoxanthomonas kalamensis TaxID=289483 RepID=UPI001391E90A|nr:hypothetical protein [Pseudoxanthomonas kalamensis]KAF1711083.1 hypothetical protein CSC70_03920 [Pseudoxanthomonas kalamensis DSM 18571]